MGNIQPSSRVAARARGESAREREREDKWHSSRSRKLRNMRRNRFAIVQHGGKSLPMVIAFILMKQRRLGLNICNKMTSFILWREVVPHTREPQRLPQNGYKSC